MKTKYQLMSASTTAFDANGNPYPDLATFPIETFSPTTKPNYYTLGEGDIYRFDILTDSVYQDFDFYDDFMLWVNNLPFIEDDANIGSNIALYVKSDIDSWFVQNVKS